jgi:hypothetical protein
VSQRLSALYLAQAVHTYTDFCAISRPFRAFSAPFLHPFCSNKANALLRGTLSLTTSSSALWTRWMTIFSRSSN